MNFYCVICADSNEPVLIHEKVNGDSNGLLSVVRCSSCGHCQLNPPQYDIEHYQEDGQINFVVHGYGTPIEKIVEHSWIEADRRIKRFSEANISLDKRDQNQPLRLIDIGGGYGFFGSELKRQFPAIDVQVMEPSSKRAKLGHDYLLERGMEHPLPEFIVEPLCQEFVEKNRGLYDIVTLWHVLEHVSDPVLFLKLAFELANPVTGVVCVEVPNVDDELMSLSSAFRDRNYMIEHISYFSKESLQTVAKKSTLNTSIDICGYQRYGIFNYFHWINFNKPQGANPDLFAGKDRWWLENIWRTHREQSLTSDALFMTIRHVPEHSIT
jgi:2-polyprenyl-3-methyl-5-hydroxy-6-metoxy-1,4-benzoquinol methylase